jgi:hypothetical protein
VNHLRDPRLVTALGVREHVLVTGMPLNLNRTKKDTVRSDGRVDRSYARTLHNWDEIRIFSIVIRRLGLWAKYCAIIRMCDGMLILMTYVFLYYL